MIEALLDGSAPAKVRPCMHEHISDGMWIFCYVLESLARCARDPSGSRVIEALLDGSVPAKVRPCTSERLRWRLNKESMSHRL